jgi:hypothetical protein
VANELVILIPPQLHDDAHCAAALAVHVSPFAAPTGSAGDKVANILTALRPTFRYPCRRSVLNPTLARLERDFMRAIHNMQESGGGHQKEIANAKRRRDKSLRVRGVGEGSAPDSEIGRCVPLATSC